MEFNTNLHSYSVFMFGVVTVITLDDDDMIGHGGCCMFFFPSPGILIMVL